MGEICEFSEVERSKTHGSFDIFPNDIRELERNYFFLLHSQRTSQVFYEIVVFFFLLNLPARLLKYYSKMQ